MNRKGGMEMNTSKRRWLGLLALLVATVGFVGVGLAGELEPPGPPGSTMKTLDEIPPTWSQKITDASKRFEIVLGGVAVLDKETGLVWQRYPDGTTRNWNAAMNEAYSKEIGGRRGWRLPTVEELASLLDSSGGITKLPSGNPFGGLYTGFPYWSSTTSPNDPDRAMHVDFLFGNVGSSLKTSTYFMWCVRGGHGHDGY
jgi:hypothetical protein